jgi:hypothetical protein
MSAMLPQESRLVNGAFGRSGEVRSDSWRGRLLFGFRNKSCCSVGPAWVQG